MTAEQKPGKVSVVMAAYNGEKYIEAQIASVLKTLSEKDELIVSVDPSKDSTLETVKAVQDPRITVIEGPGLGVCANFENALKQASGDIIFLCDQDDLWLPQKRKALMDVFENNRECVAVVHDAVITDENLHVKEDSFFRFHHSRNGTLSNLVRNSFIGCCMAFRRELLPVILPFPKPLPMHDQWIGLAALQKGKVIFLEKPLIYYRRHENNASSMSASNKKQQLIWRMQILKAHSSLPKRLKQAKSMSADHPKI